MIIYLGSPYRYINDIKALKCYRIAFNESEFKKWMKKETFSPALYIARHFSKYEELKVMIFKESGEAYLNNKQIASISYPEKFFGTDISTKILVLNIPKLEDLHNIKKASITTWCIDLVKRGLMEGFSTHLANQKGITLALKLEKYGLSSFDFDMSIYSSFKKIIFPSGLTQSLKQKGVVNKVKGWAIQFHLSSKEIIAGNFSELIKFNYKSLEMYFNREKKDEVGDESSIQIEGVGEYTPKIFSEEELPKEIRELPQAFQDKDDLKIIGGVMRLLKEETLRYYEIRLNEKHSKTYDFDTSKVALGIIGKTIDLLKVMKPEMAGVVNQYFLDNRKLVLSAVIKEFSDVSPEERKQLIGSLRKLQQERKQPGSRGNVVVVGESTVRGKTSPHS